MREQARTRFARALRRERGGCGKSTLVPPAQSLAAGCKFKRQRPCIVDFACVERGPVAEAESSQPLNAHAALSAPARFKLLRFWNNEVLANIDSVCGATASALVDPIALPFFLSLGRT
ncbi:DUF559 domain-containing protein [Xanthomonas sp. AmX2]|uniref:DUF559 domain-containing protein n=1 Tax=Xanthomonas sp. TaxID=29446 RepID=UPI001981E80C|nr:DUF559 domain-containing protein [Xanthomonas sp.]MBN6152810.1 DUF559 domain-containing protein [Xanthomonas sp.]